MRKYTVAMRAHKGAYAYPQADKTRVFEAGTCKLAEATAREWLRESGIDASVWSVKARLCK